MSVETEPAGAAPARVDIGSDADIERAELAGPTGTLWVPWLRGEAVRNGWTRPGGVREVAHVGAIVAVWAALVTVGQLAGTWWVWPPVWLCIAFLIVGLAGVGHDCVHSTLVGPKRANTIAGHLVMLPIALPFATYRQFHLLHHADTLGDNDPEGPPGDFTSRAQYGLYHLLLGPAFVSMIWWSTMRGAVGRPPAWARTERSRTALRTAWLPAVPAVALLVTGCIESDLVRHAWLYPWLLALVPVLPFVLLSEHYAGHAADGTLHNTYTIESNPITRFAVFNINFHTAHHLLPKVPSASLGELDGLVRPHSTRRATGYLAFHRGIVGDLPWRASTPKDDDGAENDQRDGCNA